MLMLWHKFRYLFEKIISEYDLNGLFLQIFGEKSWKKLCGYTGMATVVWPVEKIVSSH